MPYVVQWREVGHDREFRSRYHLRQASAQRKLSRIRGRRPPERRRRLRVIWVEWDRVVALVLVRLLLLGGLLLLGFGVASLAGWI